MASLVALAAVALLAAPPVRADAAAPADTAIARAPADARAWQLGLLRGDRVRHATLSFTLAAGAGVVSRRPAAAFGGAFALGVAKELRDARGDRFDPLDLAADVLGAALGALAVRTGRL